MPISNVSSNSDKGPGGGGRTTFRPPWVKETTPAVPWSKRNPGSTTSTAKASSNENGQQPSAEKKEVKLQSKEIKVPIMTTKKTPILPTTSMTTSKSKPKEIEVKINVENESSGDGKKSIGGKIPIQLNKVPKKELEKAPPTQDMSGKFIRPVLKKVPKIDVPSKATKSPEAEQKLLRETPAKTSIKSASPGKVKQFESSEDEDEEEEEEEMEEEEEESDEEEETEEETESEEESSEEKVNAKVNEPIKNQLSSKLNTTSKLTTPSKSSPPSSTLPVSTKSSDTSVPPPPPPMPKSIVAPPPPPPPPPPGLRAPQDFERKPMTDKKKKLLEKLRIRPRKRPDWSDMMKEVESGIKLKHVKCNDRSTPILTSKSITNIKGQYIYETEKANVHNALLKQIQSGVRLKRSVCNDRSKPILEGLRKFRRQMTIEEQIQKSESRAQMNEPPEEDSTDEMDDIDKLRDDLQSTKQMLALELRNKEAQERENKRLLAKIANLEAELHSDRQKTDTTAHTAASTASASNETLVQSLKHEAEEAQQTSIILEKKYQDIAEQLDTSKNEIEEQKRQIQLLEKKLQQGNTQTSDGAKNTSETTANKDSSPEPEIENSDSEDDESDEKKAERAERRLGREIKMMKNKLSKLKDKEKIAKKERENIREAMKKNQGLLKIERKKYKALQKEVDKMAALMKDDEDEDGLGGSGGDDDEEEKSVPGGRDAENKKESDDDEESESDEESEVETDDESQSEPEDAENDVKKANYEPRIKRHDGRLAALKKGNYLLQTNVDRLQDEINMMREKSITLQADLDSVLSELG